MRRRNALIALSNNRGPFLSAIHSMNIYGALLKVVKYAVQFLSEPICTIVSLFDPAQSPDHPVNLQPASGKAVRITFVPEL